MRGVAAVVVRVLAFPLALVALWPRGIRVRWMEFFNREHDRAGLIRLQSVLRVLVQPYVLLGDFLEMARDPFGFQRARQSRYGPIFVHGKCVVFTDYATVRKHMTASRQRKAHLSPVTGQDKHPQGPVTGTRFFISTHDELYVHRRRFLAEHLFQPTPAAIDRADAMFKASRSVQEGRRYNLAIKA